MTTDERIAMHERNIAAQKPHRGPIHVDDAEWLLSELKAARAYMAKQPCPTYGSNHGVIQGHDCDGIMLAAFDRQREKGA